MASSACTKRSHDRGPTRWLLMPKFCQAGRTIWQSTGTVEHRREGEDLRRPYGDDDPVLAIELLPEAVVAEPLRVARLQEGLLGVVRPELRHVTAEQRGKEGDREDGDPAPADPSRRRKTQAAHTLHPAP